MRTRSQSRRRRQQQVPQTSVESPNLEKPNNNQEPPNPPIVTLADNRTMAQLLEEPTEGFEDAIVVPEITANNFEIKHDHFYDEVPERPDQNQRDLPRDNPLVSVEVLRYDIKRSKSENKGIVPTEMELVLEQTQQGTSHEVSITVYQACWNKLKIKAHCILKQDKVQRIKVTSKTEDIYRMLNSFTEYELKNMLYDKMQQSRSFQEHYKHLDLYNALISSIGLDEAITKGDIYLAKVLKKRHRDDKDEDPPAKSDKEKKMRKLKDYEPPKDD
ncbi:hypothetical protein Tco_0879876 [Tanacetum coccineum]